jgi:hypothetical protein
MDKYGMIFQLQRYKIFLINGWPNYGFPTTRVWEILHKWLNQDMIFRPHGSHSGPWKLQPDVERWWRMLWCPQIEKFQCAAYYHLWQYYHHRTTPQIKKPRNAAYCHLGPPIERFWCAGFCDLWRSCHSTSAWIGKLWCVAYCDLWWCHRHGTSPRIEKLRKVAYCL